MKDGRVYGTRYAKRAQVVVAPFDYIEAFYNRTRRHFGLGYRLPVQFLQDWVLTLRTERLSGERDGGGDGIEPPPKRRQFIMNPDDSDVPPRRGHRRQRFRILDTRASSTRGWALPTGS